MKKSNLKFKPIFQKTAKYFFDFFVVFIGVFLAFWLNARKEEQNKTDQQTKLLSVIYEDLNSFYISGRVENLNGFINLFKSHKRELDSLVDIKKVPPYSHLIGDYWQLEIINSLVQNGQLKELDPNIYKGLAQFNTVHQNFLAEIEGFNQDYVVYITKQYDNGLDGLYKPGSNELKEASKIPFKRLLNIIDFAELLVEVAKDARLQLNEELSFDEK